MVRAELRMQPRCQTATDVTYSCGSFMVATPSGPNSWQSFYLLHKIKYWEESFLLNLMQVRGRGLAKLPERAIC